MKLALVGHLKKRQFSIMANICYQKLKNQKANLNKANIFFLKIISVPYTVYDLLYKFCNAVSNFKIESKLL
jgi:hypothetical protein